MGVTVGNLVSAGVFGLVTLLPKDQFDEWGWRLPFLGSILLPGFGVYIRAKISETPVFWSLPLNTKSYVRRSWRRSDGIHAISSSDWRAMAENRLGYLYLVFGLSYVTTTLGVSRGIAIVGIMLSTFAEFFCVAFFAWLSDKIGRRPVYIGGGFVLCRLCFSIFSADWDTRSCVIAVAFIFAIGVGGGAMFGPQAAYFAELLGQDCATGIRLRSRAWLDNLWRPRAFYLCAAGWHDGGRTLGRRLLRHIALVDHCTCGVVGPQDLPARATSTPHYPDHCAGERHAATTSF